MDRIASKRKQIHAAFEVLQRDQRLASLTAEQVMTVSPRCVARTETAYDLVKMVHANCFRHLLVSDGDELVGVISDRDIILCFDFHKPPSNDHLKTITAADLMSTDLITVGPLTPVVEAIRLMIDCGINCLPVVLDKRPVGILTSTDMFLTLEQLLTTLRTHQSPATARGKRRS